MGRIRGHPSILPILCALLGSLLIACGGGSDPAPTAFPTATPSPVPPTSTPTPLPPVPLTIRWPSTVSALEDVTVWVELPGLMERDPTARLRASLFDPLHKLRWTAGLEPAGEDLFASPTSLHIPMDPPPGEWELRVSILATVPITGARRLYFRPEPVPLREPDDRMRETIYLSVPQAFLAVRAEGDTVAGWRTWIGAGGEVSVGWTPGPAEPLGLDTALMLVEAGRSSGGPVEVLSVEPANWDGLPAFRFVERWPEGPAEEWVVQGPDRWLYLLRIRTLDGRSIPPLFREILTSFHLEQQTPEV